MIHFIAAVAVSSILSYLTLNIVFVYDVTNISEYDHQYMAQIFFNTCSTLLEYLLPLLLVSRKISWLPVI